MTKIELSKLEAAYIQQSLASTVSSLQKAIRETNVTDVQVTYAQTINSIRLLQAKIERAQ